jgi:hypothetical protein
LRLTFFPVCELNAHAISLPIVTKVDDEALETLTDRVVGVLAGRMQKELSNGLEVHWIPDWVMTSTGLGCPRKHIAVPYDRLLRFEILKGVLYLYADGDKKPLLISAVSAPNVLPGLEVLSKLANSLKQTEAAWWRKLLA